MQSLRDLHNTTGALLHVSGPEIVRPNHGLNLNLDRAELLIRLEMAIRSNPHIHDIVEIHPLGFVRIPFTADRRDDGMYLHIWTGDAPKRPHAELPHAHSFFMQSRVVFGEMLNRDWKIVEDAEGGFRLGGARYNGDTSAIVPDSRRISYSLLNVTLVREDETYIVPKGCFHSSEPAPGTVTLMHKTDSDYSIAPDNILPISQESSLQSTFNPDGYVNKVHVVDNLLDRISHAIG